MQFSSITSHTSIYNHIINLLRQNNQNGFPTINWCQISSAWQISVSAIELKQVICRVGDGSKTHYFTKVNNNLSTTCCCAHKCRCTNVTNRKLSCVRQDYIFQCRSVSNTRNSHGVSSCWKRGIKLNYESFVRTSYSFHTDCFAVFVLEYVVSFVCTTNILVVFNSYFSFVIRYFYINNLWSRLIYCCSNGQLCVSSCVTRVVRDRSGVQCSCVSRKHIVTKVQSYFCSINSYSLRIFLNCSIQEIEVRGLYRFRIDIFIISNSSRFQSCCCFYNFWSLFVFNNCEFNVLRQRFQIEEVFETSNSQFMIATGQCR
ncbi:hypothetical protein D3C76_1068180 [compost metagenome]